MRQFFMNTIIAVFQLKHLISKTPGLKIFKMWYTIFESSKLTDLIRRRVACTILGPAPAPIAFIRNVFRYRVLIICKRNDFDIPKKLSQILKNAKCRTKIDVDAVSFY